MGNNDHSSWYSSGNDLVKEGKNDDALMAYDKALEIEYFLRLPITCVFQSVLSVAMRVAVKDNGGLQGGVEPGNDHSQKVAERSLARIPCQSTSSSPMILRLGGLRYVLSSKPERDGKSFRRRGTALRSSRKSPSSTLTLCYSILECQA